MVASAEDTPSPFQYGPIVLHPHLLYRFLYSDGTQARPGHPTKTNVNNIAPGITVDLGTYWKLDYTPTWNYYSSRDFKDTLDHVVDLSGLIARQDWTLQLDANYAKTSSPLVETGSQTSQKTSSGSVVILREIRRDIHLELNFNEMTREAEDFPRSSEWKALARLHYLFSEQLDTALGLQTGYLAVNRSADSIYFRPQAEITWRPIEKITAGVQGGVEHRRTLGRDGHTIDNPIYSGSIRYQPVSTTALTLAAARDISNSYFRNELSKASTFSVSLEQRLLEKFQLTASVRRQEVHYISTLIDSSVERRDRLNGFDVRLSRSFLRRGSIGVSYGISRNSSDRADYTFSNKQFGVDVSFKY